MRGSDYLDQVIAENVRRLREERRLSVAQLAARCGVHHQTIRDYEGARRGGRQRPFLWSELVRLCVAFEVTIFDLVLPVEKQERTRAIEQWAERKGLGELIEANPARGSVWEAVFGIPEGELDAVRMNQFRQQTKREFDRLLQALQAARSRLEEEE